MRGNPMVLLVASLIMAVMMMLVVLGDLTIRTNKLRAQNEIEEVRLKVDLNSIKEGRR